MAGPGSILALNQGTTSGRAIVFGADLERKYARLEAGGAGCPQSHIEPPAEAPIPCK
jgi:hypothetical protein